ncbi:vitamin K epoxide reductase family protein [Nesterenkonia massiliensis]|uniref:vitamin K epoxide reductase family protein n=1 Tax=Nesterenkonia massiliensis TaxID=1232429 RepID=UPI0003F6FF10|nr:vitamin K epoxide reductase family protein [Nesterenkonia massiliensis]
MFQTPQKPSPPSERPVPGLSTRFTGLVLLFSGLLGLVPSFVLAVEKYWLLTNPFYSPSCTLGETLSCVPVMTSWQAEVFGFPNPYLGIAGFAIIAATGGAVLGGARLAGWYWTGLQLGAILGTLFVGWLMYQSMVRIQALCPYCMLVWVAMFLTVWYVSLESVSRLSTQLSGRAQRLARAAIRRHEIVLLSWFVLVGLLVNIAVVNFS